MNLFSADYFRNIGISADTSVAHIPWGTNDYRDIGQSEDVNVDQTVLILCFESFNVDPSTDW